MDYGMTYANLTVRIISRCGNNHAFETYNTMRTVLTMTP